MSYRILLLEQDETLANLLCYHLKKIGHTVYSCHSDDAFIRMAASVDYDIIILDIEESADSLQASRLFKQAISIRETVPVLLLASWNSEADIANAFLLGVEGVITKPFGYGELISRMNAVMRRIHQPVMYPIAPNNEEIAYRIGLVNIYPQRFEIQLDDQNILFRKEEFFLVFHLLKHPDTIFSIDQLYEIIFGKTSRNCKRVVHVVSALRKKLLSFEPYIRIQTIPSSGYRLTMR
jgi:two-component system alkaline phosphatase synthesis response regulator PhoP